MKYCLRRKRKTFFGIGIAKEESPREQQQRKRETKYKVNTTKNTIKQIIYKYCKFRHVVHVFQGIISHQQHYNQMYRKISMQK